MRKLALGLTSILKELISSGGAAPSAFDNTYSVDFDGVDDYVDLSSLAISDSSAFSVSAWVKLDSYDDTYPVIIALKTNITQNWRMIFSSNPSYGDVGFGCAVTFYKAKSGTGVITLGQWHHIVVTYNGSGVGTAGNWVLYVDGGVVSTSAAGGYGSDTGNAKIGSEGVNYWNGNISDVSLFNKALGYSDIQKIWNGGQPGNLSSLEPVGWWRLGAGDVYVFDNETFEGVAIIKTLCDVTVPQAKL